MTIQQKIRFIRNAQPKCLEELFEMQNRICDLCMRPIQDLVFAALDHSIPIIHFLQLPLAEAAVQANDPKNLRCAHMECNSAKKTMTRVEWFARGLNNRTPRLYSAEDLVVFHLWAIRRQKSRAGAGGRAAGLATKAAGTGIFSRTSAEHLADSAAGGRKGGRTNASVKGYLSRIGKLGAAATARKHCQRQVTSLCSNILN
jgi:hypothetical protein